MASTKKLATGSRGNCTQNHFRTAGDSNNPKRRVVRKTQTHAKTCHQIHRTPRIREIVVVAALAEDKTEIIIQTAATQMAVNPVVEDAQASKTLADPRDGQCPLLNSPFGKNC